MTYALGTGPRTPQSAGDEIGDVIERVYEAACDQNSWPAALDALAQACGSLCATFFTWNNRLNRLGSFVAGRSYHGDAVYRASFASLDPRRKLTQRLPERAIFRCHQGIDEGFVRRDIFYQEFSLPHERRFLMAAHLLKSDDMSCFAVLHRSPTQGHFTDADTEVFALVAPHLRRAATVQMKLGNAQVGLATTMGAWNRLPFAMLAVDHAARVIQSNDAAEALMAGGDGVTIRRGHLAIADPTGSAALMASVRAAAEPGRGEESRQGASLLVPRPSGRSAYRVLIAPLPEQHHPMIGSERLALVLVTAPEATVLPPEHHLASLFGLTGAEAQIALALCTGRSVEEVAGERGVSTGTVRSQIKAILRKTETERQADLVRTLLSTPVLAQQHATSGGVL